MTDLEKFKRNRTIFRSSVTKFTCKIDRILKNVDFESIENFNQLKIKVSDLKEVHNKVSIAELLRISN